jgi:O-6-methylguanine DNA methyltransferase
VWGVCCRALPDVADAEDAFQATFLVLVRRGRKLTGFPTIGPWLHKVAAWTARNVRRHNARRLARQAALPVQLPAPNRDLDLPLDIRGTAFQRRVWETLRRIPPGATATYADIAKAIGSPAAVRAVGRACGSNPIALAIPCHRVVGSNGSLTGYRGGVERKRALLAKEAKS